MAPVNPERAPFSRNTTPPLSQPSATSAGHKGKTDVPVFSSSPGVPWLADRVYVVTGATSGLGLALCRRLASAGATVVLCGRTHTAAIEAAQMLLEDLHPRGKMVAVSLDLSSLSSVRQCCSQILDRFKRLSCLVCNAAVRVPLDEFRRTQEGYDINFGVNHLGHFLMAELLMPRLLASSDSRVVLVSSRDALINSRSDAARLGENYSRLSSHTPVGYAQSKLMNMLHALRLDRLHKPRPGRTSRERPGLRVFCVFPPEWCRTGLFRHSRSKWFGGYPFMCAVLGQSPEKGCETIFHCATSVQVLLERGLCYANRTVIKEMDNFLKREMSEASNALWKRSEQLILTEMQK